MPFMRDFVLGLSVSIAFIVGCLVGGSSPQTAVPNAAAEPDGPRRYEYKCTNEETLGADDFAKRLNREGAEGWDLEGSFEGPLGNTMCFSRAL